jgi:glutathione S-transferase
MSEVIIYGSPYSTYVRTARMACVEKGVDHRLELATRDDFRSPAHLAVHPFAKIPAMRHGELVLHEVAAICHYLNTCFDGPALAPEDPLDQVLMVKWISACNDYFYGDLMRRFVAQYVFPKGPDGGPDRDAIDAAQPDIRRDLGILEEAYGVGDTLAGGRLTLADLFITPMLAAVARTPEGPALLESVANVRRSMASMQARASFTATDPEAWSKAHAAE